MSMRAFILFCIFCLTGTASAAPGLDVLDTVFLFPIDSSNQVFPNVPLKDGTHEGLITRPQLDSVLVAAQSFGIRPAPGSAFNTLPNWKVVAFRYDPCSPDTPGGDDCMQELRVVAQPFTAAGPVDTSLHITYGLGRGLPRADDPILQDLLRQKQLSYDKTKVLTAGFPLGTHPVLHQAMLNQGKGYALPILDFLRKYAVPGRLKKITMMGLKNASAQSWTFFGGDVVNGQWQLRSIPNSPDSSGQMIDFDLNSSDRLFFPVPENKYLSTYGFFHRETLGEGEIDTFRQNLHVIENPRQSNRNSVDCLSCHSATSIKMDINQAIPKFVAGKTFAMPVRTTGFVRPGSIQRHKSHWNLRALGYFGNVPTVSTRMVYEAALVADRLNRILGLTNPGKDCSARRTEVISCFENAIPTLAKPARALTLECLSMCVN